MSGLTNTDVSCLVFNDVMTFKYLYKDILETAIEKVLFRKGLSKSKEDKELIYNQVLEALEYVNKAES